MHGQTYISQEHCRDVWLSPGMWYVLTFPFAICRGAGIKYHILNIDKRSNSDMLTFNPLNKHDLSISTPGPTRPGGF